MVKFSDSVACVFGGAGAEPVLPYCFFVLDLLVSSFPCRNHSIFTTTATTAKGPLRLTFLATAAIAAAFSSLLERDDY